MNFSALVLSCLLLLTSTAGAQELWGSTRAGMTVAEAKNVQPGAITPAKADSIPATGAVEMLRVNEVDIGALTRVKAGLFFSKEGRLVQVSLAPMADLDRYATISLYRNILLGLKAKYGNPLDDSDQTTSGGMRKVIWVNQKTKITALYSVSFDLVNVIYTADGQALGSGL